MTHQSFGCNGASQISSSYLTHPGIQFPDREVFQRWIVSQYHELPFRVEFVDYDPYPTVESMTSDLGASKVMKISALNNDALLDPEVNLMFRAIHDFDHCLNRASFSLEGEIEAGKRFLARCNDRLGRAFLFSEIIAQAVVFKVTESFARQKFVPFSPEVIDRTITSGGGSPWQ